MCQCPLVALLLATMRILVTFFFFYFQQKFHQLCEIIVIIWVWMMRADFFGEI